MEMMIFFWTIVDLTELVCLCFSVAPINKNKKKTHIAVPGNFSENYWEIIRKILDLEKKPWQCYKSKD